MEQDILQKIRVLSSFHREESDGALRTADQQALAKRGG